MHHLLLWCAWIRTDELERDDAVAAGERQRRIEDVRNRLERGGADGDRHRHREATNDGQPGILHEHPAAEFQVGHEGLEAGQTAAIAMGFPGAGNAADPDERLAARFVRCHAGADVVVGVQIDVALQLVGEVPLAGAGPNEAGDSRPPRAQRSHVSPPYSSLAARKRVMIADVSAHCRVSRSICFRPALVSL